ncbi:MAG: carboxypeptidase regulatory-like domain-containing protein, partial [Candidatus Korarchaeota archaeon]|nr:carboxypeptidase regulatory-like domain-containing protein [Candidatus Korarchaeota archaeon]
MTDQISQDVPSANVTATYTNTTIAEQKLTDTNGKTRLTLTEKMVNATGEYPVGNYTVEATYETYSAYKSVEIAENQQITLTIVNFIIP